MTNNVNPIFYTFCKGLVEIQPTKSQAESLVLVFCTYEQLHTYLKHFGFSTNTLQDYNRTTTTIHKMDSYYGYDFGILHAIQKEKNGFSKTKIGMYIKGNMIVLVCDEPLLQHHICEAINKVNAESISVVHMMTTILNSILGEHLHMIEDIENALSDIDEEILENRMDNFNQRTSVLRNHLRYLAHYYEQLMDVCDELLEDENNFFAQQEIHHLRILADRINRLHSSVHMLKEYMLQIREAWQSQMDMNLNHIMYIFTVVTTIFLPLTLIVGWYGMNFQDMPELTWRYGYAMIIVISIMIIIACLWFFHKKKLLK